ncbi:Type I secretion system ATP-binding protein PrsD [Candidatus Filomicrobium marinum]|uniref:Type I secretion system ATP-binding protein PrsD n=2 Tax=Filomicrobium TaxID=119044 RepID=A0A0D6JEV8_9HYPH|nr:MULTISPECIES: type I secretion system permease/ATPase [Filomicrobium]MCV0370382.1 type I secretion system permease/ATPase [Filomicrobium sp.]CFX20966.1 Type I secretion system ATP-binding protein PrsD [Candidatus Filomicrobium marinum]CPR18713.1 Type I secretion system ATP-binding protein PrsD [Candidatus Filomicrobium marinum]SDO15284.1 ATP-binding cassette, subfamily C [Filomicrobium insigne]
MRSEAAKSANKRKQAEQLTQGFRGILVFLFVMSGIINILALTGAFYMLQIYDRALTSGSIPTLVAISAVAIGLYLFQGMFDIIRSQILVRIGARLDKNIAPIAHQVAIDMPRFGFSTAEALERGRDVDTVRGFLGSQGPLALFDLPWMPVFLVFVYMLHPYLGALTIGGAAVLALLTILAEILTRRLTKSTQQAVVARNAVADSNARNAEILKAMGFAKRAVARFNEANDEHLELQTRATDISGTFSAISRVLRMLLQSAVLGLGALLTINGDLTAGAIIAASVASARALAPIDLAIANWKNVVAARAAFGRLKETVVSLAGAAPRMALPDPTKSLKIENVTVAAPAVGRVLLSEVSLELKAGDALGIIGPSGGGKTTLARALTGLWPVLRGNVRLDDADLSQWDDEALGRHIGYLPQDVALLDATIGENISRLNPDADPSEIVAAARAAGVHEMIVRMPDGYQTQLGPQGASLSGGQRQRIGLARALFGNPFLVILDEPNSNLDGEGEAALTLAMRSVRERGGIVIVIAHRPSALAAVDLVAVVQNGRVTSFGRKEDVVAKFVPRSVNTDPQPVEKPLERQAQRVPA